MKLFWPQWINIWKFFQYEIYVLYRFNITVQKNTMPVLIYGFYPSAKKRLTFDETHSHTIRLPYFIHSFKTFYLDMISYNLLYQSFLIVWAFTRIMDLIIWHSTFVWILTHPLLPNKWFNSRSKCVKKGV